jgi:hypothetical protein
VCVRSDFEVVHTSKMAQSGKTIVTTGFASHLDSDVMSVITSFSRELTVLEIYRCVRESLHEFEKSSAEDAETVIRNLTIWKLLPKWRPSHGHFPIVHPKLGELTETEQRRGACALKWLNWSARGKLYEILRSALVAN